MCPACFLICPDRGRSVECQDPVMVGITYRSASARPGNAPKFPLPTPPQSQSPAVARAPAPTFKDKESYQELFKPLPKPDALPPLVHFEVRRGEVCIVY